MRSLLTSTFNTATSCHPEVGYEDHWREYILSAVKKALLQNHHDDSSAHEIAKDLYTLVQDWPEHPDVLAGTEEGLARYAELFGNDEAQSVIEELFRNSGQGSRLENMLYHCSFRDTDKPHYKFH